MGGCPYALLLDASYTIQQVLWNSPIWHEMKMAKPSESMLLEECEEAGRFSMGKDPIRPPDAKDEL